MKEKIEGFQITNEQKEIEFHHNREMEQFLVNKFSKILKQNPIEIFVKRGINEIPEKRKTFNEVKRMSFDESGTGGSISIEFNYNDYISVRKDGLNGSSFFREENDYYKISEESFQNILLMMQELIKRSGYSEVEKNKMFQFVVDGLKNKIIKEKYIKKAE